MKLNEPTRDRNIRDAGRTFAMVAVNKKSPALRQNNFNHTKQRMKQKGNSLDIKISRNVSRDYSQSFQKLLLQNSKKTTRIRQFCVVQDRAATSMLTSAQSSVNTLTNIRNLPHVHMDLLTTIVCFAINITTITSPYSATDAPTLDVALERNHQN